MYRYDIADFHSGRELDSWSLGVLGAASHDGHRLLPCPARTVHRDWTSVWKYYLRFRKACETMSIPSRREWLWAPSRLTALKRRPELCISIARSSSCRERCCKHGADTCLPLRCGSLPALVATACFEVERFGDHQRHHGQGEVRMATVPLGEDQQGAYGPDKCDCPRICDILLSHIGAADPWSGLLHRDSFPDHPVHV